MGIAWGLVLVALSLIGWGGQVISRLAPTAAVRLGLVEAEEDVEPVYWADIRGEGSTAILTWGSTTAAVREAAARLAAGGTEVKLIALRLLLPASPGKLARELEGVRRVLVVEQSHSAQFHRYLRAYYDIDSPVHALARPGPLPITPGEIVRQVENWK